MPGTFKLITLVGVSDASYEDAIQKAVQDASKSVRGLSWFEVVELRGKLQGAKVAQYQIKLQAAFEVEKS